MQGIKVNKKNTFKVLRFRPFHMGSDFYFNKANHKDQALGEKNLRNSVLDT